MPYIQRDFDGKITGIFRNPQIQNDGTCLTEPTEVSDNDPEVIAFLESLPQFIDDDLNFEARAKQAEEYARLDVQIQNEIIAIKESLISHIQLWANLETAMSALFQELVASPAPTINIARAAYFSLGGFEARKNMVSQTLAQWVHDFTYTQSQDKQSLENFNKYWCLVASEISKAKKVRNLLSHGRIITYSQGKKRYPRFSSPLFDPDDLRLLTKGSRPGLGSEEIDKSLATLKNLIGCVDRANEVVSNYRTFGGKSLEKTISRLELNLKIANIKDK